MQTSPADQSDRRGFFSRRFFGVPAASRARHAADGRFVNCNAAADFGARRAPCWQAGGGSARLRRDAPVFSSESENPASSIQLNTIKKLSLETSVKD
jgi:hypothetical protein